MDVSMVVRLAVWMVAKKVAWMVVEMVLMTVGESEYLLAEMWVVY